MPLAARALESGDNKLSIQNGLVDTDNRITGSSPSSSFLTPGNHVTDDLSLFYTGKRRDTNLEGALDGRFADDPRIEARRFNLKRFYFKGENTRASAVVGDYFASFGQYSLGTALKGGRYTLKVGDKFELTALAGVSKSNWDDLWMHNATETLDRTFYGLRASRTFANDASLGASFVGSKDSRARYNTTAVAQDQRIAGLDWSLPTFHKLRIYGESAFSKTENDNPTTPANSQHGWAHLVKADYTYEKFKTQNEFERVSPGFATTGGAAAPDLIRMQTQNKVTIVGAWRWIVNYTWFHDNLNHAEGASTTVTRMPETGLRYEGGEWRPNLSAEVKARYREVFNSTNRLLSRARSSVITSLADRFGPVSLNADYEFQEEDLSDRTVHKIHHILGLGETSTHTPLPGWKLMPSLRYNLQRDRDTLLNNTDQTGIITANVAVESPWGLDAGVGYSRNLVLLAVSPGSDHRTASASLGYNILKKPEHRITMRFQQNDNRSGIAGQDFKETIWEAGLTNRF